MNSLKYGKIILKPGKERSVLQYHPWIFSGATATSPEEFTDGQIVRIYNSQQEYLATGHFHPGSIRVRVLSFEDRPLDLTFWKEKINNAYALRQRIGIAGSTATNAFRLIHAEGDGLPGLVIDVYDRAAVIQTHSTGMQLSLEVIAEALQTLPGLSFDTIYHRHASREHHVQGHFLLGDSEGAEIRENDHLFFVNWKEGQKTGFFLDQRENRSLLARYSKGRTVLNTFCYSGGFSVYALQGGAAKVVSVDGSAKAIEWTEKNVSLNPFSEASHHSHCEDALQFLKKSSPQEFDLMVLDPPAYAKNLHALAKAEIGYRNLNEQALKLIREGGLIFTFSCSQAVDMNLFRKIIFKAAAATRRRVRILHQLSQGPDHPINVYHPEGEYLKGLVLEVQ